MAMVFSPTATASSVMRLVGRDIHDIALSSASASATLTGSAAHCTAFDLPALGVLVLNATQTMTLAQDATYQPECPWSATLANSTVVETFQDLKQPFYASVISTLYAISLATTFAWGLFILLIITPKTYYVAGSAISYHGRFRGAPDGNTSIIAVGGRPWLQKAATLLVAVSLTVVSGLAMKETHGQYESGYLDSSQLTDSVLDSTVVKVLSTISGVFLWLALVQTLIRLFPRRRWKIIIKWVGFALILADTVIVILANWEGGGLSEEGYDYQEDSGFTAVPDVSYFFECALSFFYGAAVMFYTVVKRRYAFFHSQMKSNLIIAGFTYIVLWLPLVLFFLDVYSFEVYSWGNYVRWATLAAASVFVWEWVERIEALEREERKDGILGREIIDADDMLSMSLRRDDRDHRGDHPPSWFQRHNFRSIVQAFKDGTRESDSIREKRKRSDLRWRPKVLRRLKRNSSNAKYLPTSNIDLGKLAVQTSTSSVNSDSLQARRRSTMRLSQGSHLEETEDVTLPLPPSSPISRTGNTSAASTQYTVVHHTVQTPTPNQSSARNTPLMPTHQIPPTLTPPHAPSQRVFLPSSTRISFASLNPLHRTNRDLPREVSQAGLPTNSSNTTSLETATIPFVPNNRSFSPVQSETPSHQLDRIPEAQQSLHEELSSPSESLGASPTPSSPNRHSLPTLSRPPSDLTASTSTAESQPQAHSRISKLPFRRSRRPVTPIEDLPTVVVPAQPTGRVWSPADGLSAPLQNQDGHDHGQD